MLWTMVNFWGVYPFIELIGRGCSINWATLTSQKTWAKPGISLQTRSSLSDFLSHSLSDVTGALSPNGRT